jgi:hypothetical protein
VHFRPLGIRGVCVRRRQTLFPARLTPFLKRVPSELVFLKPRQSCLFRRPRRGCYRPRHGARAPPSTRARPILRRRREAGRQRPWARGLRWRRSAAETGPVLPTLGRRRCLTIPPRVVKVQNVLQADRFFRPCPAGGPARATGL